MRAIYSRTMLLLTAVAALAATAPARAEQGELSVGVQGGVLFPGFSPRSQTAFTLATWEAGIEAGFGLLDDLSLTAGMLFSTYSGNLDGYTYESEGIDYTGTLEVDARVYHPRLGLRYKLYAGYNLAPYVDLAVGYAWSTYHGARLTKDGADIGVEIDDFGQGGFTVTGGLAVDYRLLNTVFVGVGMYFTYPLGGQLLKNYVHLSFYALYYFFP